MKNWNCVRANLKYVINSKGKNEFKEKVKLNCIKEVPSIYQLCFNKWLQLPQIESLLISLANSRENYIDKLKEKEEFFGEKDNYHLWIYSLLALHQSYASYNNC